MSRNYVTAVRTDVQKLAELADYYMKNDVECTSAASVISQAMEDLHMLLKSRKELPTQYTMEEGFARIGALFGHSKKSQQHVLRLAKDIGMETFQDINQGSIDLLSSIKLELEEDDEQRASRKSE